VHCISQRAMTVIETSWQLNLAAYKLLQTIFLFFFHNLTMLALVRKCTVTCYVKLHLYSSTHDELFLIWVFIKKKMTAQGYTCVNSKQNDQGTVNVLPIGICITIIIKSVLDGGITYKHIFLRPQYSCTVMYAMM
jgi:hypothetical protein